MILDAVSHLAGMRALVDFKAVCDSVRIEDIMQFAGIDSQTILVADIDRNGAVLAQIPDVLIHKSERRVRGPFCENVRLNRTIFHRKVEVERRVLWIR